MNAPNAAEPGSTPSAGQMLSWIRRIVGLGTRRPGYAQGLAVELWVENTFRSVGLEEVRREPVPVNYWEPSLTALSFPHDDLETPCFAVPYTSWTPETGIKAPCVFIGDGSEADFERADVPGRIVVLDARFAVLAGSAIKEQSLFVLDGQRTIPDGPLPFARWLIKNFPAYHEAKKRAAVGFIGLLGDLPIDGCEYYVPYDGFLKDLPAVWVGREHSAEVRRLAQAGRTARLVSCGDGRTVDSHNVVGVLHGTEPSPNDRRENIIVTCHHDAPFASAVEDASGLAVLLGLAQQFAALRKAQDSLQRDLVFVASSGHFHGGIGNRVFVERHAEGLLEQTVAAFGVEHIAEDVESDGHGGYALTGRTATRALFFDGSRRFLEILQAEAQRAELDRVLCLDAYFVGPEPPCDSAPFFTAGIPSACHLAAPYYLFDPHDTIDKVRVEELTAVARFFARTIRRVDTMAAAELAEGMRRPRGMRPAASPAWFQPPE